MTKPDGNLGLGVPYAAHAYCLSGVVDTLPVNVVVLLFYLHRLTIAVGVIMFRRVAITVAKLGAMARRWSTSLSRSVLLPLLWIYAGSRSRWRRRVGALRECGAVVNLTLLPSSEFRR